MCLAPWPLWYISASPMVYVYIHIFIYIYMYICVHMFGPMGPWAWVHFVHISRVSPIVPMQLKR